MGIEEAILKEVEEKSLEKGMELGLEKGLEEGLEQGLEQGIEQGIEQGLEQGYSKGLEEKERTVIINAWKKGLSLEDVADLIEAPLEKVETVINEFTQGQEPLG